MKELKDRLSVFDYKDFRKNSLLGPNEAARLRISAKIDEFILYGIDLVGPMIFLLPEVLQRLSEWVLTEEAGIGRCKALGDHLASLPKHFQGKGLLSLYSWWALSRKSILQEVRALKKHVQANSQRVDLLTSVQAAISDNWRDFPKLTQLGEGFIAFASRHIASVEALIGSRLTPAKFTDELIGYATNYTPESARQLISKYRKRMKSEPLIADL
jgi:hypothetical protein